MYQIIAEGHVTAPNTSSIAQPPPFSPPRYAVVVNSLWFLSLVISLTCALLATSLQQWARRYVRLTQPARCSPEKRARMRAFFAHGVDKMSLPSAVEGLPALIHLAVFLFFAGLIIYLMNVSHFTAISVMSWIGLFSILYTFITFMPMFRPDSPYYTPLTAQVSLIIGAVLWFVVVIVSALDCLALVVLMIYDFLRSRLILSWIAICSWTSPSEYHRLRDWYDSDAHRHWYGRAVDRLYRILSSIVDVISHWGDRIENSGKVAEEITGNRSSEIDLGILDWTISALGEDDRLEKFFEVIPGFFNSQTVKNIQRPLPDTFLSKFLDSWGRFVTRNLLSNSVSGKTRIRRLVTSMNAIKEIYNHSDPDRIFSHLSSLRFDQVTPSIQAVQFLVPWSSSTDATTSSLARYTVAKMLPYIRERDDRWIASAHDIYGLPEHILRDYISLGDDSVLLAIFNHAARHILRAELRKWEMLPSISKFDIRNTIPGLRNEFCALWNDVVREASTTPDHVMILGGIRHLYIALHQDTDDAPTAFDGFTPSDDPVLDNPESYPSCNVASHYLVSKSLPFTPLKLSHDTFRSFPHQSPSESQLYAGGSTAAEKSSGVDVTLRLTSSTDQATPPQYQETSPSPSPIVAEPFPPQANVVADAAIHKCTETTALNLNLIVSEEVTHLSRQPSPSTTDAVSAEEPIPDIPVTGRQNSQVGAAALHNLPHPGPVPVTVAPLAVSRPPRSMSRPGDVAGAV